MSHDNPSKSSEPRWSAAPAVEWWGYLHSNGTIQLKRWFGDHKDYTEDCEGNDFVQKVVRPFAADTREQALAILKERLSK